MARPTDHWARPVKARYGIGVKSGTPEYYRAWRKAHQGRVTWQHRAAARKRRQKAAELSTARAEIAKLQAQLDAQASALGQLVAALEPVKNPTPPEKIPEISDQEA